MIKPLEKNNQKGLIFLKIFFVLTLLISGILIDRLFLNKKLDNKSQILGEEKNISKPIEKPKTDFLKQALDNVEKKVEDISGQALGEATEFIQNTKEKIASSVSDIIYKTSLNPIVNQIEKLPKDQQERIKKEICE